MLVPRTPPILMLSMAIASAIEIQPVQPEPTVQTERSTEGAESRSTARLDFVSLRSA